MTHTFIKNSRFNDKNIDDFIRKIIHIVYIFCNAHNKLIIFNTFSKSLSLFSLLGTLLDRSIVEKFTCIRHDFDQNYLKID